MNIKNYIIYNVEYIIIILYYRYKIYIYIYHINNLSCILYYRSKIKIKISIKNINYIIEIY